MLRTSPASGGGIGIAVRAAAHVAEQPLPSSSATSTDTSGIRQELLPQPARRRRVLVSLGQQRGEPRVR